jgi:hypothetical protein
MRIHSIGLLLSIFLATACGGDDDGGGAHPDASAGEPDASPGAPDAAPADASLALEYDQNGCLTFASASRLCGFDSDGTVCDQRLLCSEGDELSQCKINCEMGTTVTCYKMADVECLQNAVAAHDCAALEACHWIL